MGFGQEVIWLALLLMLGIHASLLGMAICADTVHLSVTEYALFRAPFALHLGWIICASLLNINVMADASKAAPPTALGFAITSVALLLAVVTAFTLALRRPEPLVGAVAAWALAAIAAELEDPQLLNDPTRFNPYQWDDVTLSGLLLAALVECGMAALMAALAIARCVAIGTRLITTSTPL